MELGILCFNVGLNVEWQTLHATQKTEIDSLERRIKRIIAPKRHEKWSI
jgi:hypothetical protein